MKVYDSWDSFTITGRGRVFVIKDDWTLENLPRPGSVIKIDQDVYRVVGVESCLVGGHDKTVLCTHPFRCVLVGAVPDEMKERDGEV